MNLGEECVSVHTMETRQRQAALDARKHHCKTHLSNIAADRWDYTMNSDPNCRDFNHWERRNMVDERVNSLRKKIKDNRELIRNGKNDCRDVGPCKMKPLSSYVRRKKEDQIDEWKRQLSSRSQFDI